ncbi:MAG TPA: aspartate kinase [Ktedonobacterales bacterium]|nr:aspartate kinase [Ktedonobacterales bacterium]
MRVVKFGGSSVADVARMRHVAALVAELRAQGPVAVVVSAMAGMTDALIGVGQSAITGDSRLPERLEAVALRHHEAWAALANSAPPEFDRLWAALEHDARTIAQRGAGLSASARERLVAQFSGWGERLVVGLLASGLREAGLVAQAFDEAPVTLHGATGADSEPEPSTLATRARLLPRLALLVMRGGVPVLPGYIARDSSGAQTTLGRNGSDHSAAVIAAALGAERLTIYSDVPGMLTADPRIAPDAVLLPALTYDEAQRMATLGARALHPRTIEPVARWGIPLELRATETPHAPGTDIMPGAAIPRGRAREGAWIVAARPLASDPHTLAEVTAAWLPAWPLVDGTEPPVANADAARERLPLADLSVRRFERTSDGARLVVDTERANAAVRALHTALHGGETREQRTALQVATGA